MKKPCWWCETYEKPPYLYCDICNVLEWKKDWQLVAILGFCVLCAILIGSGVN